ncbi:4Fe-4S dicluster domain-containing protein [Acidobacteriota bacterium]
MPSESILIPDNTWIPEMDKKSGEYVSSCYQCKSCSSGCPVGFAMDYLPNQIVHMIRMGQKEEVLKSNSIWVCASCETCTTRCPNDIDVAKIMDSLRMASRKSGLKKGDKRPAAFHTSVLAMIKTTGRVYELGMTGFYFLKSGDMISQLKSGALFSQGILGWNLFRKGKLKLFPKIIKERSAMTKLFKKIKKGEDS